MAIAETRIRRIGDHRQAVYQFGPAVEQVLRRPDVQQQLADLVATISVLGPSQIEAALAEGLTRVDMRVLVLKKGRSLNGETEEFLTGVSYEDKYRQSVRSHMLSVMKWDREFDPDGRIYLRVHRDNEYDDTVRRVQSDESLTEEQKARAIKEAEIIKMGQTIMIEACQASLVLT